MSDILPGRPTAPMQDPPGPDHIHMGVDGTCDYPESADVLGVGSNGPGPRGSGGTISGFALGDVPD